ncbi:MAG: V-type ATP synthase subunit E family protein [Thiobacillaceae bacterium]|nr:V-type ATP synthase subunit E family protein [Thiobacillaceae bacterium]MDW8324206.1 V-type ATP synthase subunit E family protein [Burkholderiales bacterium]
MAAEDPLDRLEEALLKQAQTLARETLRHAEDTRARILSEAQARLAELERRELQAARAQAERILRRRLQAAQSRQAAEFDRLRWVLTETVLSQASQALQELTADLPRYRPVLAAFLAEAARLLPPGPLVAEVDARDYERLRPQWGEFAAAAAPGRTVELALLPKPSLGGLCVRTLDDTARVDHRFEARLERLHEVLALAVMERLFASAPDLGVLFG